MIKLHGYTYITTACTLRETHFHPPCAMKSPGMFVKILMDTRTVLGNIHAVYCE